MFKVNLLSPICVKVCHICISKYSPVLLTPKEELHQVQKTHTVLISAVWISVQIKDHSPLYKSQGTRSGIAPTRLPPLRRRLTDWQVDTDSPLIATPRTLLLLKKIAIAQYS